VNLSLVGVWKRVVGLQRDCWVELCRLFDYQASSSWPGWHWRHLLIHGWFVWWLDLNLDRQQHRLTSSEQPPTERWWQKLFKSRGRGPKCTAISLSCPQFSTVRLKNSSPKILTSIRAWGVCQCINMFLMYRVWREFIIRKNGAKDSKWYFWNQSKKYHCYFLTWPKQQTATYERRNSSVVGLTQYDHYRRGSYFHFFTSHHFLFPSVCILSWIPPRCLSS